MAGASAPARERARRPAPAGSSGRRRWPSPRTPPAPRLRPELDQVHEDDLLRGADLLHHLVRRPVVELDLAARRRAAFEDGVLDLLGVDPRLADLAQHP